VVSAKASVTKLNELLQLVDEIVNKSDLSDSERIKTILTRHLSQLEAQIKREGSGLAMTRYSSYLSNAGMFNELTRGYDYLVFIRNLVKNYDESSGSIVSKLKEVASQLFSQENLIAASTCNEQDYKELAEKFKSFTSTLPHTNLTVKNWNFDLSPKNEGIQAASKVQYVYAGYNYRKLGYPYSGKMLILNNVISRNWLYQQVRVIGGAYGGYSIFSPSGFTAFASYRDPNLNQTLDTYQKTADFIKNFTADEKEMTQFIIGAISDLDQPLSVAERGNKAFSDYFSQLDAAYYQRERDEVLSTKVEDIRSYSGMIQDIMNQQVICVYGNSDILEKEVALFKTLLRVE
jgi:presequence protease